MKNLGSMFPYYVFWSFVFIRVTNWLAHCARAPFTADEMMVSCREAPPPPKRRQLRQRGSFPAGSFGRRHVGDIFAESPKVTRGPLPMAVTK